MDFARLRFEVVKLFWKPGSLFIEMHESVTQWSASELNHPSEGSYISRTKKMATETDSAQRHKVATTVALRGARSRRRKNPGRR
jgi:hypothetical protein